MSDSNVNNSSSTTDGVDGGTVEYMLTTVDNPYDPFTQFDEWLACDTRLGYHTAAFLARIAKTSDDLSDADQQSAIQAAIDEIVRENVLGLYRKVKRGSITVQ